MSRRGYSGVFGYLDDFLLLGETREECETKLLELIRLLRYLGFAIAWEKVVSPTNVVTYLGIELDSIEMEFRLPHRKLVNLVELVSKFKDMSHASKKELQVLAGHLSHASTVVRGGRTFSRRLLNLIKYLPDSPSQVLLPTWFKRDLLWWYNLVGLFNGSAKVVKSLATIEGVPATDSSLSGFGESLE